MLGCCSTVPVCRGRRAYPGVHIAWCRTGHELRYELHVELQPEPDQFEANQGIPQSPVEFPTTQETLFGQEDTPERVSTSNGVLYTSLGVYGICRTAAVVS